MGWGLSLHMQLNTKKFSRLRRDQAIATRSPSTSHLTTFGKSNRLATLTQTSSLRSHHTTTPPRYARAYQLATLAHCTHHERIGVDRHTRRLCLSARNARLCWHTLKLHMPTQPLLSKHIPHISGALDPHFVRRTPVPSRTHYVRAHGPYTTGGLPCVPLGGYIHYCVCTVSLFYALVGLVFCVGWLGGFV